MFLEFHKMNRANVWSYLRDKNTDKIKDFEEFVGVLFQRLERCLILVSCKDSDKLKRW